MEAEMNTSTAVDVESRVLTEGYGPGAWHGPDLKAALTDVLPAIAYRRPAAGRHNIAEIALHHAYCTRAVRAQISGRTAEPFVLKGEDWFDVADERVISWQKILDTVDTQQQGLGRLLSEIGTGTLVSPLDESERFNLVLGITCHAVYHAGQIQLIKRLAGE
jgi:hypothetical protein